MMKKGKAKVPFTKRRRECTTKENGAKKIKPRKKGREKPKKGHDFHHLNPQTRTQELIAVLRVTSKDEKMLEVLEETIEIPITVHRAWNNLFASKKALFAWEVVELIRSWKNKDNPKYIYIKLLGNKGMIAWGALFGFDLSIENAIKIVKEQW